MSEKEELRKKCKWVYTTYNGVYGCVVIGPNGKCIFLPAAGYIIKETKSSDVGGSYWTSNTEGGYFACALVFDVERIVPNGVGGRFEGNTVRAVCP